MNKTLRISFALRNTYRVNSILFSLKQIPLLKKLLPNRLYQIHGLKVFANVLSVLWEIISVFLGKGLYFLIMIVGIGALYQKVPADRLFLHILLFLTSVGSFANTYMFNPTKDKYYAMILMRMNAREYTLVNYTYAILKVIVGFLPFSLLFGLAAGVPLPLCILIPFFVAGFKMTIALIQLTDYEKRGIIPNENKLSKYAWIGILVLLAAAYGLPALGITVPVSAVAVVMGIVIVLGIVSIWKIKTFSFYQEMNKEILRDSMNQMDKVKEVQKEQSNRLISGDTSIKSSRKGFEYLNELFMKRHQKILWKASKRVAFVSLILVLGALLLFYLAPEIRAKTNELILTYLPYFVFIMYAINRGTGFTNALFMNCDHSLLTYSFYKQPGFVLKLFQIRLREIIKVNLLPAAVIGGGLSMLLFASGGTDNPWNYAALIVSILCMSMFFSVHYLTIYYLLQPYNAGTEMKSGTYQIVLSVTYVVCFLFMRLRMSTLLFGALTIVFCVAYSVAACVLVYFLAPKTFRLRT